ncbi:uncharacterized protein ARMOST_19131 [Armillaria ostoyae]|uniref:Uncharacterized protein n=1 Tax=Armillaria ostoyae TaxID=47428 RepID=A0A284S3P6_ARMOS|nr:uncharacterized protein ARMOST_19131 [Armillaria ostoyae]
MPLLTVTKVARFSPVRHQDYHHAVFAIRIVKTFCKADITRGADAACLRMPRWEHKLFLFGVQGGREGRFKVVGGDRGTLFQSSLLSILLGHSQLVMLSFRFQRAFRKVTQARDNLFFNRHPPRR